VSLGKWSGQKVPPRLKGPAEAVLHRLIAAVDARTFTYEGERESLPHAGQTLREFINEFQTHWVAERHLASSSLGPMLGVISAGLGHYTLDRLVAEDGPLLIERWLGVLQRERGFGDTTWNHYRSLLRRLFNRAMKWRRLRTNPVLFIDPKVGLRGAGSGVRLEEDVEDRLLAACEQLDEACGHPPNRTQLDWEKSAAIRARVAAGESQRAVAAAYGVSATCVSEIVNGHTWNRDRLQSEATGAVMRRRLIAALDLGLRAGEMLNLTLPMIDFSPQCIEVGGVKHEVLVIALPPSVTKGGKRTGKTEYVYAGTERLKAILIERRAALKNNPGFRQHVFGREDGSYVGSFDRPWRRLFELAGLDWGRAQGLVWHALRHEFISRTLEQTGDPVVAQAMARHKDVRTTQGYLHARPTRLLAAAVALNRAEATAQGARRPAAATRGAGTGSGSYADPMPGGRMLPFPRKSA
jgi:integrase